MKLIAIVGQAGSGKDVVGEYLCKNYGFKHVASGDILRRYIVSHGLGGTDRGNIQKIVRELRANKGNDILVKEALADHKAESKLVISGIRHPDEASLVKQKDGIIIAVISTPEARYKRIVKRQREGDDISFEKFIKQEATENQGRAWDIKTLISNSDYTLANNSDFKSFVDQIDALAKKLKLTKTI